jgi:hypothetical protein
MEIGGLYLVQPPRLTSDSQDHTILPCIRQILRFKWTSGDENLSLHTGNA